MTCEQCGNEFFRKAYNKNGKEYVRCPFCGFENEKTYSKKKKKRFDKNQQR